MIVNHVFQKIVSIIMGIRIDYTLSLIERNDDIK